MNGDPVLLQVKGCPGEMGFQRSEGRLVSGAVPSPAARPLRRGSKLCDRCFRGSAGVGIGMRSCQLSLRAVGVTEGHPRGGVPCAVVRGV